MHCSGGMTPTGTPGTHGLTIRHRYLVWCQGETDGDHGTDPETYTRQFGSMLARLRQHGVETCFLVAIGQYNGIHGYDYTAIHKAQLALPGSTPVLCWSAMTSGKCGPGAS